MEEKEIKSEFYKQALLKQYEECILFLQNSPDFLSVLNQLLELPGNDPSRDSLAIVFRWAVQCLINKINGSTETPDVPLDFSSCHPALQDPTELVNLANEEKTDIIMDLVENFNYEFFKTLKKLRLKDALQFCISTSKNLKLPLHLIGRIISSFKVAVAPFDFTYLLAQRCQSVATLSSLYEGLMCGLSSSQLESAELLSNHSDPFLNEDALLLANQAARIQVHWVDTSGALTRRLFPSFSILNFLFQVGQMNSSEMLKQLQSLPVHPITTKFKNQILLSQVLGLGDDWQPLSVKSIPAIITPEYLTNGVLSFPRETEFITISQQSWERDFDFIEGYLTMKSLLKRGKEKDNSLFMPSQDSVNNEQQIESSDENEETFSEIISKSPHIIAEDLFSLIFLNGFNDCPILTFEEIEELLQTLLEKISHESELYKYIEEGIKKCKAVRVIYGNKSKKKYLFYPIRTYFDVCLTDKLAQLFDIFNIIPNTAISKVFQKSVNDYLLIQKEEKYDFIFNPRYVESKNDDEIMDKISEILENKLIPKDKIIFILLDFSLSHRQFTICSKLYDKFIETKQKKVTIITSEHESGELIEGETTNENDQKEEQGNENDIYKTLLDTHIFKEQVVYPDISDLTFCEGSALLQRKILELNAKIKNGQFIQFANYMLQLAQIGTSKFLQFSPKQFLTKKIQQSSSVQNLLQKFENTSVDILSFLFKEIKSEDLSKIMNVDIVKECPLTGFIYAQNSVKSSDISSLYPQKIMQKWLNRSDHFEVFYQYKDAKETFIETGDLFYYSGEENLDTYLPSVLENIKKMNEDDAISILNDLALQFDLEPYYTDILEITQNFASEKCKDLIETLCETFPVESNALIFLYKRLDSYRQKGEESEWNTVLNMLADYHDCFNDPEKIYRLTKIYLAHHTYNRTLVRDIQLFVQCIIIIRKMHFFNSIKEEEKWILKSICPEVNSIGDAFAKMNEEFVMKMVMDIAINKDVTCMLQISKEFNQELLMKQIKKSVTKNPKIVLLLDNIKDRDSVILSALKHFTVNSIENDNKLIRTLSKFEKYLSDNSKDFLNAIKYIALTGLYSHHFIAYSTKQMGKLLEQCFTYDLTYALDIFRKNGLKFEKSFFRRMNDGLTIFGLTPKLENGIDSKLLFTSPDLPFNTSDLLNDFQPSKSLLETSFRVGSLGSKIVVYKRDPSPIKQKKPKQSDFTFYDISSPHSEARSYGNIYSRFNVKENAPIGINLDADFEKLLTQCIAYTRLIELFDACYLNQRIDILKQCLETFDNNSCLFSLLALATWSLQHRETLELFSGDKHLEGDELEDFVELVKSTLASACALHGTVDPSVLLPPGSIQKGERKVLDDIMAILNYQRQVQSKDGHTISLFSAADKGHAVKQLIIISDYDRAFTLMRALGVDVNDVMIEAAGYFGQKSNRELCEFLVNVIPRMDVEPANQLIEALASILVGNKFDDSFIKGIIAGIDEPRNAYRILRWFGLTDAAAYFALQNGLKEEIESSLKESKLKKGVSMIRACACWLSRQQHTKTF